MYTVPTNELIRQDTTGGCRYEKGAVRGTGDGRTPTNACIHWKHDWGPPPVCKGIERVNRDDYNAPGIQTAPFPVHMNTAFQLLVHWPIMHTFQFGQNQNTSSAPTDQADRIVDAVSLVNRGR